VPSFRLSSSGTSGIHFAALPAGHQLVPFLKALELVAGDSSPKACHELDPNVSATELQSLSLRNVPGAGRSGNRIICMAPICAEPFLIVTRSSFPI